MRGSPRCRCRFAAAPPAAVPPPITPAPSPCTAQARPPRPWPDEANADYEGCARPTAVRAAAPLARRVLIWRRARPAPVRVPEWPSAPLRAWRLLVRRGAYAGSVSARWAATQPADADLAWGGRPWAAAGAAPSAGAADPAAEPAPVSGEAPASAAAAPRPRCDRALVFPPALAEAAEPGVTRVPAPDVPADPASGRSGPRARAAAVVPAAGDYAPGCAR